MKINEKHYHTIWLDQNDPSLIQTIDQRVLPHRLQTFDLRTCHHAEFAIREMVVRGAPLIGVTAAFGMYLSALEASPDNWKDHLALCAKKLNASRPTAVNLAWAVNQQLKVVKKVNSLQAARELLLENALQIKANDIETCRMIGQHGMELIKAISQKKKTGEPVNILTHCNAGWLACIDWGTATSPIYQAFDAGIKLHVWVDETRPRNQGANLTAYELGQHGIPHTLITDNTGGHLMQHGMVDLVIVGTDRTTKTGDVANKIGTYLKALAAKDNNIPFYVGLPSSTIDWTLNNGITEIPIEKRDEKEVKYIQGFVDNDIKEVLICPENTPAVNYGFDVTPARLITGLITERGICQASETGLNQLFLEHA